MVPRGGSSGKIPDLASFSHNSLLTGWPPFYDKNLRKMCEQILRSELQFPPQCAASPEARDLIRALLQRDPAQRLGSRRAEGGVGAAACPPPHRTSWLKSVTLVLAVASMTREERM